MRSAPYRSLSFLPLIAGVVLTLAASPARSTSFSQSCFDTVGSPGNVVADFNNDGNIDVAMSPGSGVGGAAFTVQALVNVYLGDGLGGFTLGSQVATTSPFVYLTAADVNGDGNQDLAVAAGTVAGTPLSINLGNGNGTFQASQNVAGAGSDGLAFADLNSDGKVDLVTGEDKTILVQFNSGTGTFGAATVYRVSHYSRAVSLSDVTGDGLLDVVALGNASNGNPAVMVLPNKGAGVFGKLVKTANLAGSGIGGRHVQTADFNSDGKKDVAVTRLEGGGVTVALGNGDGSFGSDVNYPMAGHTNHLGIGDINGDGNLDIAAASVGANASSPTGNVTVLDGNGSGGFTVGNVIAVTYGLGISLGDANEDGDLDIIEDTCLLLNDGTPIAARQSRLGPTTAVSTRSADLTASFSPNPTRGRGVLGFSLPKDGKVSIHLYDLRGRRVHTLADRIWMAAGPHTMTLDRQAAGLSNGLYFYRIDTEGGHTSGRIVIANQ